MNNYEFEAPGFEVFTTPGGKITHINHTAGESQTVIKVEDKEGDKRLVLIDNFSITPAVITSKCEDYDFDPEDLSSIYEDNDIPEAFKSMSAADVFEAWENILSEDSFRLVRSYFTEMFDV